MIHKKLIKFLSWNSLSLISNFIVSFAFLPIYVNNLSHASFGILSLLWTTLSLSTILDFGLGRSLVREIASMKSEEVDVDKIRIAITTSLYVSIMFAIIAFMCTEILLNTYFYLVSSKFLLSTLSIFFISLSVFLTILNNTILSIFEGDHKIALCGSLKILFTVLFFGLPGYLLYINYLDSIEMIVFVISIIKLIQVFVSAIIIQIKYRLSALNYSKVIASRFLNFGKWLTISNLTGIIMTFSDRFIIGFFLNPFKLVNYTISADLIQKGSGVVALLPASIYPLIANTNKNAFNLKNIKVLIYILSIISIIGFFLSFIFIDDFLMLWLKKSYNPEMTYIFRIMLVGWISSGFGQLFLVRLHSIGDTKSSAIVHIIECIAYIPALLIGIKYFGLVGAASVFSIRLLFDAFALWYSANKYENE